MEADIIKIQKLEKTLDDMHSEFIKDSKKFGSTTCITIRFKQLEAAKRNFKKKKKLTPVYVDDYVVEQLLSTTKFEKKSFAEDCRKWQQETLQLFYKIKQDPMPYESLIAFYDRLLNLHQVFKCYDETYFILYDMRYPVFSHLKFTKYLRWTLENRKFLMRDPKARELQIFLFDVYYEMKMKNYSRIGDTGIVYKRLCKYFEKKTHYNLVYNVLKENYAFGIV